jgi:hypothetical protein
MPLAHHGMAADDENAQSGEQDIEPELHAPTLVCASHP